MHFEEFKDGIQADEELMERDDEELMERKKEEDEGCLKN